MHAIHTPYTFVNVRFFFLLLLFLNAHSAGTRFSAQQLTKKKTTKSYI